MFCTHCGQQLPEDAAFCSKCGSPTQLTSKGQRQPPVSKHPAGHWEYKEFTHRFEPFTVPGNLDGGLTLASHVDIITYSWLSELKRSGWEPDESVEFSALMEKKRLHRVV